MPKFKIRYISGNTESFEADRFAEGSTKTLPAFYDFYRGDERVKRVFVHALQEEPQALSEKRPRPSGSASVQTVQRRASRNRFQGL